MYDVDFEESKKTRLGAAVVIAGKSNDLVMEFEGLSCGLSESSKCGFVIAFVS